jgi:hypothetical protein
MARPVTTRLLHIFGDETSHTGEHDFLVYGTMSCDSANVPDVLAHLEAAAAGPSELKWNYQNKRNWKRYRRYVDAIFDLVPKKIRFRCVVIDTNDTPFKDNLAIGMKSFIFLNLITYARDHKSVPVEFTVLLDHPGKLPLEEQRNRLNNRDSDENDRDIRPFKAIRPAESDESRLVQAADIFSGAIAFVWNKHHESGNPGHKKALAEHIAFKAQIPVFNQEARDAGIRPGDIRTLGMETARPAALRGIAIWPVDWKYEHIAKLRADSKSALAELPQEATFSDMITKGFHFALACPRCNLRSEDYFQTRGGHKLVGHNKWPPCPVCTTKTRGIVCITGRPR